MKSIKRIIALLLTAVMTMTMSVTAFAADGNNLTVSVQGGQDLNGQTISLYKLFDLSTSNSGETVGDYIGQCTDFNKDDPTTVGVYTWSKIKGETGNTGTGIAKTVRYYMLQSSPISGFHWEDEWHKSQ